MGRSHLGRGQADGYVFCGWCFLIIWKSEKLKKRIVMHNQKALKKLTIKVPIYNRRVFVAGSEEDTQIIAEYLGISKEHILPASDLVRGRVCEYEYKDNREIIDIIWFDFPFNRPDISHECVHVCLNILDLIGVSVTSDAGGKRGDEAFAYLHTWLYKKVCKKLKVEP